MGKVRPVVHSPLVDCRMMKHWKTTKIVLRGQNKIESQDAALSEVLTNTLILAVADGVGTQPNSAMGAQKAMDILRSEIKNHIGEIQDENACQIADRLFMSVSQRWQSWARNCEVADPLVSARSVQCTFALCVEQGGMLAVRSVGDSLCYARSAGGKLNPLLTPVRDESGGVSTLLTSEDITNEWTVLNLDDPLLERVVLTTDGLDRTLLRAKVTAAGQTRYFEHVDPYLNELFVKYENGDLSLTLLESELTAGLIEAHGAKGDDIGIAMANR